MQTIHKLLIAFLAGAVVPTSMIYLTGGSSRFLFLFGFTLALALVIIPCLLWAGRAAKMLEGVDKAKRAFNSHMAGHKEPEPEHAKEPDPTTHPWRDDITSALVNLKMSNKRALELFDQMVGEREYGSMEEMLGAALKRARA